MARFYNLLVFHFHIFLVQINYLSQCHYCTSLSLSSSDKLLTNGTDSIASYIILWYGNAVLCPLPSSSQFNHSTLLIFHFSDLTIVGGMYFLPKD